MTLNVVMTVILCYFTEIGTFGGPIHYVTVVKVIPILPATEM